jgi:hypothetical protein
MLRLGADVMSGGKLFQMSAPATGNAQAPRDMQRERGTSKRAVSADLW